jgi:hypothetical protein
MQLSSMNTPMTEYIINIKLNTGVRMMGISKYLLLDGHSQAMIFVVFYKYSFFPEMSRQGYYCPCFLRFFLQILNVK